MVIEAVLLKATGTQPKQNNPKTTPKQPQNNPKTTPNDNDNDNDNDNVNVDKKKDAKALPYTHARPAHYDGEDGQIADWCVTAVVRL